MQSTCPELGRVWGRAGMGVGCVCVCVSYWAWVEVQQRESAAVDPDISSGIWVRQQLIAE